MSNPYLMSGNKAQWEVFWVKVKGGKKVMIAKDFDTDLTAAIDLFYKAKTAGKPFATLRCKNVAFPPPTKYKTHIEVERTKVRRNGKIFIKKTEVQVTPMVIVNHRGIVWCPYCREFRKFRLQDGRRFEGIYVPQKGYYCLCGISSENGMVRQHNPAPPRVAQQIRRSSGASTRRASTRTRRN